MRISTGYQNQVLSGRILDAQSQVHESRQRVLTGKKWESARQNPTGARMLLSVNGLNSRLENLEGSLRMAKGHASLEQESLSDITSALNQARQLGIQANTASLDEKARASLAKQIDDLKTRVVAAGNVSDADGSYVFAGQSSSTKPFAASADGTITFAGDDLPRRVEVMPGELLRVNTPGAGKMIEDIAAALDTLKAAALQGKTTDALAQIEGHQSQVLTARAENGTVLNRIGVLQSQNQSRRDDLAAQASDLQEIDLAEAMTQYQASQTAYEAALRVMADSQQPSLMDFMQ